MLRVSASDFPAVVFSTQNRVMKDSSSAATFSASQSPRPHPTSGKIRRVPWTHSPRGSSFPRCRSRIRPDDGANQDSYGRGGNLRQNSRFLKQSRLFGRASVVRCARHNKGTSQRATDSAIGRSRKLCCQSVPGVANARGRVCDSAVFC
jgi:hypothetical protein